MKINFDKIKDVLDNKESIFEDKIDPLTLTAAVSKIHKSFPETIKDEYVIKVISNYIKENPEDYNTKGKICLTLSHTGFLNQYLDRPEISSII